MTSRTSLELHADLCRVVEVEVTPAARRDEGDEARVRAFVTAVPVSAEPGEFSSALRRVRDAHHLARVAAVTLWGLTSTHQFLRLPPTSDGDLEARAIEEAKEEIALLEKGRGAVRVALTAGDGLAGADTAGDRRREVSLTAALASEIELRLQPIEHAGFTIDRVVTPAMALTSVARARHDRLPGTTAMYVALASDATCIAIVRDGALLMARELRWGHESRDGDEPYETRLTSELRRSALYFRQTFRTAVGSVALCGDFANLRALTPVLGGALGVPVETLDSLSGIDAASVPEPADVFRADVAALRAAIAVGAEPAPYANLLPAKVNAPHRVRGVLRYAAALAAIALVIAALWYGVRRSVVPQTRPVLQSAAFDTRVTSSAPARVPARQDGAIAPDAQLTAGLQNKTRPTTVGAAERAIVVTSILFSPDRQLALIDGRIARAGDRIGSSRIVEIGPNAIVVESADGERHTVELVSAVASAKVDHDVTSVRGRH